MLTALGLALPTAGMMVLSGASPALAQEAVPFDCPAEGILTQATGGSVGENPSEVIYIDMASGESSVEFTLDTQVNAVGYNVLDNFIYGWRNTPPAEDRGIVRFGANGVVEPVPTPAELGTGTYLIGDVDENGHLWLQDGDNWYQVDLTAEPPEVLADGPLTGVPGDLITGADWTYVPGTNALYQTYFGGGTTYLYEFDRATGEFTLVGDTGLGNLQFGATYADPAGYLYGSHNSTGEIYRFDVETGEAVHFADGPSAEHNDGARCFNAPIPVDFGDAPDGYGTLLDSDGARHSVPGFDAEENTAPLMLGENISIENDGRPSPEADLDTYDDGVAEPLVIAPGHDSTVTVTVTNNTDEPATLIGWIDLDGNGTFDDGESSNVLTIPPNSGTATYELTFPAGSTTEDTYARFRLYGGEVSDLSPVGTAYGGEVEDYLVVVNNPEVTLDKSADADDLVAGETITYQFVATNTGDEPLEDVEITETNFTGTGQMSELECDQDAPVSLDPDEALVCTATYEVQQEDVDTGVVVNTAETVGVGAQSGALVDDVADLSVPGTPNPGLTGAKWADRDSFSQVGEVITYTFEATNTGNLTLSDVTITDDLAGLSPLDCAPQMPATLAPAEVLTCTATYEVTQDDLDAGEVANAATFTGDPPNPDDPPVSDTPPPVEVPADQDPELALEKVSNVERLRVGETITYTFVATNIGNVTLSDVEIAEAEFTGAGAMSPLDCDQPMPTTLLPDQVLTCTATYVVQEADMAGVENTAQVTGNTPGGDPVTSTDTDRLPDSRPKLPVTGSPWMRLGLGAGLLLVVGAGLLVGTHRWRQSAQRVSQDG